MSQSEIFDNFVKIAQEKGMISSDSDKVIEKKAAPTRANSLISDIEALYGVKPDTNDNMEYENNIVEVAHPNSAIVAPSYDKLNGLVENINERQNIIINILRKPTNGLSTNHKYAQKELLSSLVSLANDLDNRDKEELRVLTDACLMQMYSDNKQLKKEAVPVVPVVVGLVALVGAIYAHQHLDNLSEGLKQDYDNLMSKLDKFLNSSISWGVGHEYDQDLKNHVQGFEARLKQFWSLYESITGTINELEMPRDTNDAKKIALSPQSTAVFDAHKKLDILITNISDYIAKVESNFKDKAYKARHTKNKGMITSLLEKTHLLGGDTSLMADDFLAVLNAIGPFKESVAGLMKMLQESKTVQEKLKNDIAASSKTNSEFGITPSGMTDNTVKSDPVADARSLIHNDIAGALPPTIPTI